MRKVLGFIVAAVWALSAAYAYGIFMLWVVGAEQFFAVCWRSLLAVVAVKITSRVAGLLAPDSRVLAIAFFLAAALVASFVNAGNVYLVVAILGLVWEGWRLWASATVFKPLFVSLGLEGAGVATVVHAMMIADTVGRIGKETSPTKTQVESELVTRPTRSATTMYPGLLRHALRDRILSWMGLPPIPYRAEDWKPKRPSKR